MTPLDGVRNRTPINILNEVIDVDRLFFWIVLSIQSCLVEGIRCLDNSNQNIWGDCKI